MKKKYIPILLAVLLLLISRAQAQEVYYHYKGEKKVYPVSYSIISAWLNDDDSSGIKETINGSTFKITSYEQDFKSNRLITGGFIKKDRYRAILKSDDGSSTEEAVRLISALQQRPDVVCVTTGLKSGSKDDIILSNTILVKLKKEEDLDLLKAYATQLGVSIMGKSSFLPLWYILECNKGLNNSTEVAAALYSSNQFEIAEPDFMNSMEPTCVNDPNFPDQWGLKNTGQSSGTAGIDIKACDAWQITKGDPSIITAVVDQGVNINHPDLAANIYGTGYDASAGSSPSYAYGGEHATACAGIIAAIGDNNAGISGVAPNTKIMSVGIQFLTADNQTFADGIAWAKTNGASVISNSWGNSPGVTTTSTYLESIIHDAFATGRNGLGCVVVFANGNANSSTGEYPANSLSGIVAVGAINRAGFRATSTTAIDPFITAGAGSSYGDKLDVVAPGVKIYTLDKPGQLGNSTGDYFPDFGGTSAACPFVSGVAALILSVNPCLTHQEVHDIICRTAQKINTSTYSYSNSTSHPLGTWNNEIGYGLVDAESAIKYMRTTYLQHRTETYVLNYFNDNILAGSNVTPFIPQGAYTVSSGANITIRAKKEISLEDGFDADNFTDIYIETGNPPCGDWSPPFGYKMGSNSQPQTEGTNALSLINDEISVYPNPIKNKISIDYTILEDMDVTLALTNIYGQTIFKSVNKKMKGSQHDEIENLSDLRAGVYILNLCRKNDCKTFKIIKND